jgi:hypothetical protein
MSGGCDGAIRFWDIRRAGCFRVLDLTQSQLGRRPPLLKSTPENVSSLFPIVIVCCSEEYLTIVLKRSCLPSSCRNSRASIQVSDLR